MLVQTAGSLGQAPVAAVAPMHVGDLLPKEAWERCQACVTATASIVQVEGSASGIGYAAREVSVAGLMTLLADQVAP